MIAEKYNPLVDPEVLRHKAIEAVRANKRAENGAKFRKLAERSKNGQKFCANGKIAPTKVLAKKVKKQSLSQLFVRSAAWKALRASVLAHYGSVCMACGATKQIQVDHIKPKSRYPELALNFDNLQVLCWPCNKEKGWRRTTDYRLK